MTTVLFSVHWVGVLVATLATTIAGGVWFTVIFGRSYANVLGRDHDTAAKPAPIFIFGPMVCSLATIVTHAVLIELLGIATLAQAAGFGALVGVGYLGTTMTNTAINPNMPRPLAYAAISGPFFFLTSVMACVIVTLVPI